MSDPNAKANRPKARQSISHLPSSDAITSDKENVTVDTTTLQNRKAASSRSDKKKSRSKSMGPGGLEALKESTGNSAKVGNELHSKAPTRLKFAAVAICSD